MISFDTKRNRWRIDFDKQIKGKRHRVCKYLPATATEDDARAMAAQLERGLIHSMKVPASEAWDAYVDRLAAQKSWVDEAMAKCRYRSARKGNACTIDREFLLDRLRLTRGRCELTGLRFCTDRDDEAGRPFAHSVDRIDSKLGYTRANIRIVCAGINVAMMHWGEALFGKLAVGYVLHQYGFMADMERGNLSQNSSS